MPKATAEPPPAPPEPAQAPVAGAASAATRRGLLYRRGSVHPSATPASVPLVGVVEMEPTEPEKPKGPPRRRARGGVGRRAPGRSRAKKKPEEPSAES